MAVANVTISKGGKTVTIQTAEVTDNYSNKLFPITPPQSTSNQASGPKSVKIVDLLRIIHTIIIKGFLTPGDTATAATANAAKDDLNNIFKGAGASGGTVALVYDGDTFNGYIEKLTITEKTFDEPPDYDSNTTNYSEVLKYEVAITFIEGVQV